MNVDNTLISNNDSANFAFSWKKYFSGIWQELFLLMRYNLLFCLCCIPIITIPASITAMHNVSVCIIRGDKPSLKKDAIPVFKREFGRSLLLGSIVLAIEAMTVTGFIFYINLAKETTVFILLAVTVGAIALLVLLMSFYMFTMLALLDLSIKNVIKNAFLLTMLNFKYSICAGVYVLILIAISVFLFPLTIPLTVTILLALIFFTATYFSYYGINKFILSRKSFDE